MFTITPLISSDHALLKRWLNVDFISRWYDKRKFVYDDIERSLAKGYNNTVPVTGYLIKYQDKPLGYIHKFQLAHYPKYQKCVDVGNVICIDMFIGDREHIHKGLGKDIVRQFLKEKVFIDDAVSTCITGPAPSDISAIRMYEKAGFSFLKTVHCKDQEDPENIMTIKKSNETVVYAVA